MGIRFDNFKSKFAYLKPWVDKFPDEIDYDKAFKNHAVLMKAYGTVLKNGLPIRDSFCRNKFVESHIYKKLRLLRNIYLVEIAALYGSDNNALRSTLKKSVEDIDTLQSNLFNFPIITAKGIFYIITTIAVVILAAYPALSAVSVAVEDLGYISLWLLALGFYFELFLVLAFFSFIDKRLLFIFPEYKPQGLFDKCKKRWKAFLGEHMGGTVYEKEKKTFNSFNLINKMEPLVDCLFLIIIILVAPYLLIGLLLLWAELGLLTCDLVLYNAPPLLLLLDILFFLFSPILVVSLRVKRKAK